MALFALIVLWLLGSAPQLTTLQFRPEGNGTRQIT